MLPGERLCSRRRMMADKQDDGNEAVVTLREITRENIIAVLGLSVAPEQKSVYPRSNGYSIAEGHYPTDDDPVWMRVIYADETPVGFLMTSEAPDRGEYFLWRLMVDAEHQRRGYGSRAVKLLIERIKASGNARKLLTSHLKGDGNAGGFYEKLGFAYTGEVIGGIDYVMEIAFWSGEGSAAS
jgi:diamine N-acetyltransferase